MSKTDTTILSVIKWAEVEYDPDETAGSVAAKECFEAIHDFDQGDMLLAIFDDTEDMGHEELLVRILNLAVNAYDKDPSSTKGVLRGCAAGLEMLAKERK